MTYATRQDLIDRFGQTELVQFTDRTNKPASAIDDTMVARAIGDAVALADSYLAKAYDLPIAAVPPALTRVTADIARYFLAGSRAEKDGPIERAHRQALAWLRDVAAGVVLLDVGSGEAPAPAGNGGVRVSTGTAVFTRDTLKGY